MERQGRQVFVTESAKLPSGQVGLHVKFSITKYIVEMQDVHYVGLDVQVKHGLVQGAQLVNVELYYEIEQEGEIQFPVVDKTSPDLHYTHRPSCWHLIQLASHFKHEIESEI